MTRRQKTAARRAAKGLRTFSPSQLPETLCLTLELIGLQSDLDQAIRNQARHETEWDVQFSEYVQAFNARRNTA